jgi:cyclopropane-fatty-acyl-phospholipid synthase
MGLASKLLHHWMPGDHRAEALQDLLSVYPQCDFQVRLWDGFVWGTTVNPRFSLILNNPHALEVMSLSPDELSLGESYVRGDFEIEGDIEAAFDLADHLFLEGNGHQKTVALGQLLRLAMNEEPSQLHLPKLSGPLHSLGRDRAAVTYHYNVSSDFYALWLDPRMVYSCAYFRQRNDSLETAQKNKLDYLCRKLRLRPGDRLLDIGCGWGALAIHAAEFYGARALGVTLSEPQAEWARRQIEMRGIGSRCQVQVRDYRDLGFQHRFDKIVSIGMFEHVGRTNFPQYFQYVSRLLRQGGVFLNSAISYSAIHQRKGRSFIDRYVFPDGDLVPISRALESAEDAGFEVRDVESAREHYMLTLRHWLSRLDQHAAEARRIASDITYRIYRIYLAGSAHAFRRGRLNLYHTLLAKPMQGESGLPLTRQDWYAPEKPICLWPAA